MHRLPTHDAAPEITGPFADRPFAPAQHFRLALYATIAHALDVFADGDAASALEACPFLEDYLDDIAGCLGDDAGLPFAPRWRAALAAWEAQAERAGVALPLSSLRRAGLGALEAELWLATGMIEEDPRFAQLFAHAQRDQVQGRDGRPSVGLLLAWWREDADGHDRIDAVRRALHRLIDLGLLQVPNPEAPRPEWTPLPTLAAWDALRGEDPGGRGPRLHPLDTLPRLEDYLPPHDALHPQAVLEALRAARTPPLLLLRGPRHNGRKTFAGALARALGRPLLVAGEAPWEDETRWQLFGALAALYDAVPLVEAELAPGEQRRLPPLPLCDAPLIVVTGRHGAWADAGGRAVLEVALPLPGPQQRLHHWCRALPAETPQSLSDAVALRLPAGQVRRVAAAAEGFARMAQRSRIARDDLRLACRSLQTARLETLATRLEDARGLAGLILDDAGHEEVDAVLERCRWREALAADVATTAASGVGVRALFAGPSGTGKTLAARAIAAELGKDLYRVDLSATVNKYLGETEKNLNQALDAAEELDVVLLLDEGDALMANRTDVGSSNDRYANLETNFLLQRIESFEGILLVTSNAADRIDRAFARRMDAVVHFRAPDALRRYELLCLHLGDAAMPGVDDAWLQDAATRCALSGGQWRNVVLHARLLALRAGRAIDAEHLQAALLREYRKSGASCPLRPLHPLPRHLRMAAGQGG
jgi:hypothetical protein